RDHGCDCGDRVADNRVVVEIPVLRVPVTMPVGRDQATSSRSATWRLIMVQDHTSKTAMITTRDGDPDGLLSGYLIETKYHGEAPRVAQSVQKRALGVGELVEDGSGLAAWRGNHNAVNTLGTRGSIARLPRHGCARGVGPDLSDARRELHMQVARQSIGKKL